MIGGIACIDFFVCVSRKIVLWLLFVLLVSFLLFVLLFANSSKPNRIPTDALVSYGTTDAAHAQPEMNARPRGYVTREETAVRASDGVTERVSDSICQSAQHTCSRRETNRTS